MLAYYDHELTLDSATGDGSTQREHAQRRLSSPFATAADKEEAREQIEGEVECPFELAHLLEYHDSLIKRRNRNEAGLCVISHMEVESWARQTFVTLSAFEYEALCDIEMIYVKHKSKSSSVKEQPNG